SGLTPRTTSVNGLHEGDVRRLSPVWRVTAPAPVVKPATLAPARSSPVAVGALLLHGCTEHGSGTDTQVGGGIGAVAGGRWRTTVPERTTKRPCAPWAFGRRRRPRAVRSGSIPRWTRKVCRQPREASARRRWRRRRARERAQ